MARRHLTPTSLNAGKVLLITTLFLSVIGLFFVLNASLYEAYVTFGDPYFLFKQQAMHWVIGLMALLVGYFIPTSIWTKSSPWLYGGSILLLMLIFVPGIGREFNGAHRWLAIGGFTFQPIEIVKLSVVAFFARWLTSQQKLGTFLVMTGIPVSLVLLQPDLGSVLILMAICTGMFFVAGGELKHLSWVAVLGTIALLLLIVAAPYRRQRLLTFLNPESDPLGASFHIRQITLALGNGGLLGQGIGQSQQKYSYLPEPSTDSIFAVVGEELGFLGSLVVLSMFVVFFGSGVRVIKNSQLDRTAQLMAVGILIWLSVQVLLNLAAVVALVPLTGVPLPFFSYGGTALVMVLFATGILLHASRHANPNQLVRKNDL